MAEWNKGKVLPSAINGGQEFTKKDNLAINELNAIVNNSFYASNISETSISKADDAISRSRLAEEKIDEFIKTEGNSVVTLNGVPQVTWSADFAESERQKSKNLFNVITTYSNTQAGVTLNVTNNKFSINGVATSGWSANIPITPICCKKNVTYTISVNDISGVRPTSGNYSIRLGDDTGFTNAKLSLYTSNMDTYVTYTPTSDVVLTTAYVVFNEKNLSFINYLFNIQFEENNVATSYVPYNGAIVHEKDVADVEHIETIYDYSDSRYSEINGTDYGTGIKFNKTTTYQLNDLSKYKGFWVTVKAYGSDNHIRFYIPKIPNVNSRGSFVGDEAYSSNDILFYGTVIINTDNQLIASYVASYNLINGTITPYLDHDRYVIRKLEGVLL